MPGPHEDGHPARPGNDGQARLLRHLRSAGVYLCFNLWSLVPGTAALLVLVVLRQTVFLAEICPRDGSLHGNPLFCANGQVIATMLDHSLRDIRTSVAPPAAATAAQTQMRAAARAEDEANAAKLVADAAVAQARAQAELSGPDDKEARRAVDGALAQQAEAGTQAAERHREHGARSADAKLMSEAHAALFREARARLHWIGSYGAVVAFAIGTTIAAFWIWAMAIDDHLNPETATETPHRARQKGLAGLALLLLVSIMTVVGGWVIFFNVLRWSIFGGMGLPGAFDLNVLRFDDAISIFIFGDPSQAGGNLFKGGLALVTDASLMVTASVMALGAAVGATLYQTPWQVRAWREAIAAAAPGEHIPRPYERFLTRCFQRLNVCIYIGASLMVVCVVHLNAQYSWISALIDPNADAEPWKTALPNAISAFADEISFQYGLAFSTVLVALFAPGWVILRRRAWTVARAQVLKDTTRASLQDWLKDHGMGFTSVQQYAQILAVLAPAGAGVFVSILKVLTGSNS